MAADGGGMDVIDDAPEPDDSRMTLTDGPSVGVQSDKPTELGPETSVLVVPHRNVLHAAWNPTDPQLLAVAGDALCRIWSFTKSPDAPHERPNPGYQAIDIMELDHDSSVTAMSWSPDGKVLAVATKYEDGERNGEVSLWDKDGRSIDNLPAAQDYLLALSWSPTGTYLLGLTSSGSAASMVQVWQLLTSYTFPAIPLDHVAIGATWTDEHRFLVCGHSLVARFLVESENELTHKVHDDPDLMRTWTYTRYDPITKMVAIAAEDSGHLALVAIHDQDWDHSCIKAHNAGITAMTFQPETRSTPYSPTFPRRLATSSLDGDVRIWDVTNPFVELQRLNFGRTNPPMAISFDPDGHLIAAANTNRALIWNVETGGVPKARWRGEPTSTHSGLGYVSKREDSNGGMIMDGDSGIGEEEDRCTHSLDWSSDGAKLAYATGTQVRSESVHRRPWRELADTAPDFYHEPEIWIQAGANLGPRGPSAFMMSKRSYILRLYRLCRHRSLFQQQLRVATPDAYRSLAIRNTERCSVTRVLRSRPRWLLKVIRSLWTWDTLIVSKSSAARKKSIFAASG